MQCRQLIASWCLKNGNAIERKVKDGKSYFVVNDYQGLRKLFATLLAEMQRIKSEGDYTAGKAMVEKYAVKVDQELHKAVRARDAALNVKPDGGVRRPNVSPGTGICRGIPGTTLILRQGLWIFVIEQFLGGQGNLGHREILPLGKYPERIIQRIQIYTILFVFSVIVFNMTGI